MLIRNIKLPNNILLAPMSGVSDAPYRKIVKKFNPGLVFSEMIASRALIHKNIKTLRMAKKNSNEILAIQIAGCDPDVMYDAAKICEDQGADIVDINMGCPVKKIVNGYAGSALMKDENLALRIIDSVCKAIKIPVTLKMRTGWDDNNRNAPKIAKIAESLGVSLITVHGRTRCQMFKGKADWAFINKVKQEVKIPVIANGDIESFKNVQDILKISKADGLMIGRGSYGKPWIFEEIQSQLSKKSYETPKISTIRDIINEHHELCLDHYGVEVGLKSFRKHLCWYSKSLKNSNYFRQEINKTLDHRKITSLINTFFKN
ncbi:MAG: tRNA dihydrouridine synthase DusB [Rickettsiales bacterium]|nr:tRNA dihydrouridine synthase DusB [Rickettsiales bacterium]